MFLFAVLTGNCLVLIDHYLGPISQEAVVLIIFLEISKDGLKFLKRQFVDDGVVSSPKVVLALDLGKKLCAQQEWLLFLGPFDGISINSVEDGPWSPTGEAHLPLF